MIYNNLGYVSTRLNNAASVFRSFSLNLGATCNPMEPQPHRSCENSASVRPVWPTENLPTYTYRTTPLTFSLCDLQSRSWRDAASVFSGICILWSYFHYTVSAALLSRIDGGRCELFFVWYVRILTEAAFYSP